MNVFRVSAKVAPFQSLRCYGRGRLRRARVGSWSPQTRRNPWSYARGLGEHVDVSEFRSRLVEEYRQFTRSFTRIRADDIQQYVDAQYESQKYWPEPLIPVNPTFRPGGAVQDLAHAAQLHPRCAEIFRLGKSEGSAGNPLPLRKHQKETISLACSGESYVLNTGTGTGTGTGSGKSLSYFTPILDACLKAREADSTPRT